jgi:hypothetical protein
MTRFAVTYRVHRAVIFLLGGDLLDRTMKRLVPDGIDCGRVRIGGDPGPATDCALAAFEEKRAFLIRYDLQGIDSDVAIGLVGTPDGSVKALLFDGDPHGQGGTSLSRQRVGEEACPAPVVLFRSPKGRLSCFPPDPEAKRSIMSPFREAY